MKTRNSTAIISPVSRVTVQNTGSGLQNLAGVLKGLHMTAWWRHSGMYIRQAESADLLCLPSALFHP